MSSSRRFLRSSLLVPLFCTTVACALVAQEGVIVEDDGVVIEEDEDGIPAIVSLSDGQLLRGRVELGRGKRLRIWDLRERRAYYLDLASIRSIRTLVESEKMEEAWAFEEEGFRKKIKLGWHYPLRQYRQEIELDGGQVVMGHCHAAVFWINDGTRERKFILPRVQKGKRGQKPDDLVYPTGIALGVRGEKKTVVARGRGKPFAEIAGSLPQLSSLTAIEIRNVRGFGAAVRGGGKFRLGGLLPGDYAVFVRRDLGNGRSELVAGLPPEPKMSAADRASIDARIAEIAEFFEDKRIALIGGDADRPWLLLELRRRGKTTSGSRVERWELWSLQRLGDQWKVTSRVFLGRELVRSGKDFSKMTYRREPRLWKLRLESGSNALPECR